jgi:type II secretory pathway component GspD/PulD (secretin)
MTTPGAPFSGSGGGSFGFPFSGAPSAISNGQYQLRTPGPPPTSYTTLGSWPQNRFLNTAAPNANLNSISPTATPGFWGMTNPFDLNGPLTPFAGSERSSLAGLFPGAGWEGAGLNLGLSFLNDIQASLLIKAVQDSNKADILASPRVTVFNTQRANISVGLQRGYIADADVGNNGALDPQVASITTRTTLDVRPIVSADRRYVYLELFPQTRTLNPSTPFFTVTVSAAAGTGNNIVATSIPIQLPQQNFRIVETTVCVPDRGHLLIGGLAEVSEQEIETGIPVLNKIPIIKRLFSRHSTAKQRQHMLILVHPTVLIKEELENKVY